jgi:hypothetical protein
MTRFGLIGAIAFSLTLALAPPAMARVTHHIQDANHEAVVHPHAYSYDRDLPVEDALRWGYSQGRDDYPSGFGGLYGDGIYPGNVISNDHPSP